ncbi:MAG TPA: CAP domain-containing protein [Solirubrobacteraceae bacterium]|nr:CAP domain-containing protein [Solirubrobacteraceae bacterium]
MPASADQLAVVSSLPGGGCAGASAVPGAASAAAPRGAVMCLVNLERARSGLRPLGINGRLARAAGRHAADMARRGYFGHYSPRGRGPAGRARAVGWDGRVSEVLAWGCGSQASPLATVLAWLRSPPHRAILLGRSRVAGVGLVTNASCGRRASWVVDLG